MKKKLCSALLFVMAAAFLVAGIIGFVAFYNEMPEITDTKLQLFTFDSYEGQTIYCANEKKVNIFPCAITYFDEQQFLDEVESGDDFFVRVLSKELGSGKDKFAAFAVLSENGEYLSMENVSVALAKQNNKAYIFLTLGVVFAVLLTVGALCLLIERKKK